MVVNKAKQSEKHPAKGYFSPSSHAASMHEFIVGMMLGAFLGAVGATFAGIIIKGMIKKGIKDENHFLRKGVD